MDSLKILLNGLRRAIGLLFGVCVFIGLLPLLFVWGFLWMAGTNFEDNAPHPRLFGKIGEWYIKIFDLSGIME